MLASGDTQPISAGKSRTGRGRSSHADVGHDCKVHRPAATSTGFYSIRFPLPKPRESTSVKATLKTQALRIGTIYGTVPKLIELRPLLADLDLSLRLLQSPWLRSLRSRSRGCHDPGYNVARHSQCVCYRTTHPCSRTTTSVPSHP